MRHARGSLWKRWDLHVHTPASIIHSYGNDAEAWSRFLAGIEALPSNIKVIGINDYLFLDGYVRVLEERERGRLANIELVLPVLELRLDKFGGAGRNHLSRVNFHVIFSDTLSPEVIEQQFISRLDASYRLDPERGTERRSWEARPTRESLRDLGTQIIASVPAAQRHRYGDPLHEGFSNLNFGLDSVRRALASTYFEGKHLTAVGKTEWEAIQWNDGTIADKKDVINGVHLVFTSAPTIEKCLEGQRKLSDGGVNSRLLDCSDAHTYAEASEKDRLGKCFTWINADTEFEGLVKAVHEYQDRVFLGEIPGQLDRVVKHRTKYVRGLTVSKVDEPPFLDPWLDGTSIEFNYGLVAIIGNKGSGKSALLDVLGLLGDSVRHIDASFLSAERFCRSGDNKAQYFEAQLTWEDDTTTSRILDAGVASSALERVTYVPQKAFEKICNELDGGEHGPFYEELKRVIFSHTSLADRLGCETLDDLLDYRTAEVQAAVVHQREELSTLNGRILMLERRSTAEHRDTVTHQLERRRAELTAHDSSRPDEVPEPPGEADPHTQTVLAAINTRQKELDDVLGTLQTEVEQFSKLRREVEVLDRVRQRVDTFRSRYEELRMATERELQPLGISVERIVRLELDTTILDRARADRNAQLDAIELRVGDRLRDDVEVDEWSGVDFSDFLGAEVNGDNPQNEGSLFSDEGAAEPNVVETLGGHRDRLNAEILALRSGLDAAHESRQAYVAALEKWQQERDAIIGSEDTPGSIRALEAALVALEGIPTELETLYVQRRQIAHEIHGSFCRIAQFYRSTYMPVQRFIAEHDIAREVFNLRFNVAVMDAGFEGRFWDWINRGRIGSFLGQEEGSLRVRGILAETNFNEPDKAVAFAEQILDQLRHDCRTDARTIVRVASQLRANRSEQDLLDFLFGFEYLEPRLGLRMGDRELHQLSPGEKGALLLVFYLLVDQSDSPLLIDQPEENLDNQTVVRLLVPSIRAAKKHRQIFIVTHNPNLAVVCGADQIICAERSGDVEPRLEYCSGAVENPIMNRKVVDILEGTKQAFDIRGASYFDEAVVASSGHSGLRTNRHNHGSQTVTALVC